LEETPLADAPKRGIFTIIDPVVDPVLELLDDLGGTVLLFLQALTWLVRPPFRIAQFLLAIEFIGAGSLFIAGLVGVFTGMAFTVSTIVGFRQFSAEGMVGGVVALALARELAPVLAAVVVTARAGSTMASELGNMRVTEQIDAITTMGVSPVQYLVVPRIVGTVITLPMLASSISTSRAFTARARKAASASATSWACWAGAPTPAIATLRASPRPRTTPSRPATTAHDSVPPWATPYSQRPPPVRRHPAASRRRRFSIAT
jgi:ABC-type transporter Mla maintaining outer membrane lipid asymmetry permease subunit MlaE